MGTIPTWTNWPIIYAVTAVCAVNEVGIEEQLYSETGANLWVCAPSDDLRRDLEGERSVPGNCDDGAQRPIHVRLRGDIVGDAGCRRVQRR